MTAAVMEMTTTIPEPGTGGRKMDGIIRESGKDSAEFHQKQHTKLHFRRGATVRYGYKKRSSKYVKQKKRLTGQAQPLIFSGKTKEEVQNNYKVSGTATKGTKLTRKASFKGGSGRLRLKKGTNFLTRQQEVALQIAEEIKTVTPEEVREINAHRLVSFNDRVATGFKGRRRKLG